ncbi:prolyl oligopeptidase family serine peptidase [Natranaerobius thermophilus]|uniref:Peptidase S9 prolyl oligopeptidase catalytic domain-containing protein n=1 Tax=Natranaerobius thermophilus (strain ATCC BAA-1301 / DSM 18059 / JW/NM-WN-LF) TaxID=457570 RepID=B2A4J2_NATTJ|nr:prolyl oligopeptidase family serine peptidase [Natranaerobius thermophilus]ACB85169.1 conserved hypothetical protein [Natranaerobius thermophilus JW/NM-WN-LF]
MLSKQGDFITCYRRELAQIPCVFIEPKFTDKNLPTVFIFHGWSSKKENYNFMGKIIAAHGFNVLIPDAMKHGDRGELKYNDLQIMEQYFWQVVLNSLNEFEPILTELKATFNIDPDNISVMGSSMGGITASGIFAMYQNITSLIVMNGACAWQDAENRIMNAHNIEPKYNNDTEDIQKYDPLINKESLYPRPILMQHGEDDDSVPLETQRYFYSEIKNLYKDRPDSIKLTIHPNLNHHKTVAMLEEAVNWLQSHHGHLNY